MGEGDEVNGWAKREGFGRKGWKVKWIELPKGNSSYSTNTVILVTLTLLTGEHYTSIHTNMII